MTYQEIQGDLFAGLKKTENSGSDNAVSLDLIDSRAFGKKVKTFVYYAHCIAADGKWSAGIAPIFIDRIFKRRENVLKLLSKDTWNGYGYTVTTENLVYDANLKLTPNGLFNLIGMVKQYHLITKEHTSGKPTYLTLFDAIESMKYDILSDVSEAEDDKKLILRLPKIGCGLDGLSWDVVSQFIQWIFKDTEVNIEVYYI